MLLAATVLGALVTSFVGTGRTVAQTSPLSGDVGASSLHGDTYHPIDPVRLLDTRYGNGLSDPLAASTPATFQIAGRGGIPGDATAVTGNVTVVNETASFAIYVGPNPTANPTTSMINFVAGEIVANGVTVALGDGGTLSATYLAASGNTTDMLFDATGYFTPDMTGATFHALNPVRLLDTRVGNGLPVSLSANTPATFVVAGRGGVPSNAIAVTGNVTVTDQTDSYAVFVGPVPNPSPTSSTINFAKGDVRANGLTVALGTGTPGSGPLGSLSATYMAPSGNKTSLVLDVTGYFTPDLTGATFVPIDPARLLDTRVDDGLSGPQSANTPATFQLGGRGGVPSNAAAVSGNLTVTDETDQYAVFVGPAASASPSSSTINFVKGNVRANGLTVALGAGGTLSLTYMSTRGNTTSLVFDATGYFASPSDQAARWDFDLFDPRAERYQNPDAVACTAAAAQSMLNTVAFHGVASHLSWLPTTSFSTQESILAYERNHMTMLTSSAGTDPHGWRNALNYFGWGSLQAGVYRDSAYDSFSAAATATISALATHEKPVGILAQNGHHAQFVTGYEVTGDDPRTGSVNFTVIGINLTDPWAAAGHRDTWITLADWQSGGAWIGFGPYLETDSPYRDSVDGQIGYNEWYGRWVIIDPIS
ncbi:MAG TPA: hypothetical protein VF337_06835 [Candidatus Limnocylindrales bacterium]